jgi:thiol-disulfide isomerase/thioredoxin
VIGRALQWCARQGGMLVAPRRTVAALAPDQGTRDGTWAVLAYLVAGRLDQIVAAIARIVRLGSLDALLMSLADIGISLLPPVAATFGAELVLGRARGHRASVTLAPLVLSAAVGAFMQAAGWRFEPSWSLDAFGVVAVLGLALWIRRAVPPVSPAAPAGPTPTPTPADTPPFSTLARTVGAMFGVLVGVAGGLELARGVQSWSSAGPVAPGEATPAFEVALLDGSRLASTDLPGSVSVVTFWATWCGFCREELRELDALDDTYAGQPVRFVAVNHEGGGLAPRQAAALARNYRDHTQLGLPIAIDDGTMARGFRVGPIPHTVVLDHDGRIRHVHQGRVRPSTIADEIDELLAESQP